MLSNVDKKPTSSVKIILDKIAINLQHCVTFSANTKQYNMKKMLTKSKFANCLFKRFTDFITIMFRASIFTKKL